MNEKFKEPDKNLITIYKISGCKYCENAISLLKKHNINYNIINSDKYISTLQNRDNFTKFIKKFTIKHYPYFPIIFYKCHFIGGYMELISILS